MEQLGLYLQVERDGAFVLDAEGVGDKARVDEFRTNNVALKRQLDSLIARYEGIEPDAVKPLLAANANPEEQKLLKDGGGEKRVEPDGGYGGGAGGWSRSIASQPGAAQLFLPLGWQFAAVLTHPSPLPLGAGPLWAPLEPRTVRRPTPAVECSPSPDGRGLG